MNVELNGHNTRLLLSAEPWNNGILRLIVGENVEIPFLMPALTGHHYFTGVFSSKAQYEPHSSPATLTQHSEMQAVYHQPETPYTHVETRIEYEIIERGTVEMRFKTQSHAKEYPYGYVGLFWGTLVPHGGQRGFHLALPQPSGNLRWYYFQAGGDNQNNRNSTVLGPNMPFAEHHSDHSNSYFFAESRHRFALPIQVARWRDLYYSFALDTIDVAFTNVLMGTAVGGPSWDVYWRLRPGESKSIRCRLTIGKWNSWEAIEENYRSWRGCVNSSFAISQAGHQMSQVLSPPEAVEMKPDAGLALSRKLFESRGRQLLEELNLLNQCAVGCFGGTSQNLRLDDKHSRDHIWGPYLTFLLNEKAWQAHHERLEKAVAAMPDEVDGVRWIGYGGPHPRKTGVREFRSFLQSLTGLEKPPQTDREWLPHLTRVNFLGRSWTEQLFDATQGEVFHDPGERFTQLWRHWTLYVPPDIHRALLAQSLFRIWNAGPEYNLKRMAARRDRAAFELCRSRFMNEVLKLAFCWNEQFIPHFKWRVAQFHRLPICPSAIRQGINSLSAAPKEAQSLEIATFIVNSIKMLMKELYHLTPSLKEPLSVFAHAMHNTIEDAHVKNSTSLDW
ncbi:MAG: DUF4037 domain-containing protein [Candidatus Poribacteria bacterium]|nr:DUF4037 domain-containing protein [Candidatus Poribacteria bacterium]